MLNRQVFLKLKLKLTPPMTTLLDTMLQAKAELFNLLVILLGTPACSEHP